MTQQDTSSTSGDSADHLLRQRFEAHVEQLAAPVAWQWRYVYDLTSTAWTGNYPSEVCARTAAEIEAKDYYEVQVRSLYTIPQAIRDELYDAFCVASMLDDKGVPRGDALRAYSLVERVLLFAGQEQWRPIETAPKGKLLWMFEPQSMGGFMFVGYRSATSDRCGNNLDGKEQIPTHWRPLPSPPGGPSLGQPTTAKREVTAAEGESDAAFVERSKSWGIWSKDADFKRAFGLMCRGAAASDAGGEVFKRGHDWLKPGADHETFGIDVSFTDVFGKPAWHGNQIEVHGDSVLRDKVLALLATPQPAAPAAITEEMVERACKAYSEYYRDYTVTDLDRGAMRAALQAAGIVSTNARAAASLGIGKWLSAALDDPNACADMKADINAWFEAGDPCFSSFHLAVEVVEKLRAEWILRRDRYSGQALISYIGAADEILAALKAGGAA